MEEPAAVVAERIVREALLGSSHSGNSTVTLNVNDPERDKARGERAWIAAGLGCVVAIGSLWVAKDAKDEVRNLRVEQAIMNGWTAQEVSAIRSYITTGKLAPMAPRPIGPPQQEKQK